MPQGHTQITGSMTVREAFLNVLNEDIGELFSRVETLEREGLSGVAVATEEEAVQGQNNTKMMTPLRVRQAIVSNPENYLKTSLHTKSLHDSLHIDADTVDGKHASDLRLASDHVILQSGKVVDFADEVGDKIRLWQSSYGLGINNNELTLYAYSGAEVSLRQGAWNGTKLGDFIHTGNMLNKGVSMPLARYTSTSGYCPILYFLPEAPISFSTSYRHIVSMLIPWSGVLTYSVNVLNSSSSQREAYIKINSTEYGPYTIQANSGGYITANYTTSSSAVGVEIWIKTGSDSLSLINVLVMTGNADCLYKIGIWAIGMSGDFKVL